MTLSKELLRMAEEQLRAAQALLAAAPVGADEVEGATDLMAAVEAALAHLASEPALDAATAGWLLRLRSDLSGHLLAAASLEAAGASPEAGVDMLRRATATTLAGIRAISDDRRLVVARR